MPPTHRAACAALIPFLALLGAVLGGCFKDPYTSQAPPRRPTGRPPAAQPAAVAKRTHEIPARSDSHTQPPPAGAYLPTTPRAAVQRFAERFTNWTYLTLHARQLELTRYSADEARQAMQLAAQSTSHDNELKAGKTTNTGHLVSLAPRLGGPNGAFVVVTLERTSSKLADYQGLKAGYHVTLARTAQVHPGRYAITSWQPQN